MQKEVRYLPWRRRRVGVEIKTYKSGWMGDKSIPITYIILKVFSSSS